MMLLLNEEDCAVSILAILVLAVTLVWNISSLCSFAHSVECVAIVLTQLQQSLR